jgi:hypothetical protein
VKRKILGIWMTATVTAALSAGAAPAQGQPILTLTPFCDNTTVRGHAIGATSGFHISLTRPNVVLTFTDNFGEAPPHRWWTW